MKHLRCIGGPNHGAVIGLAAHEHVVRLVDKTSLPALHPGGAVSDRAATVTYLHYTQRRVATAEGSVYFLAPAEMSDMQALRNALGPMGTDRLKQLDDLKRAAEAFRRLMIDSAALHQVPQTVLMDHLRKLETALDSENYEVGDVP